MPLGLTKAQLEAEFAAIHEARLALIENAGKAISYTVGGRQVTIIGPNAIEKLNAHEAYVKAEYEAACREELYGSRGIRVRAGVVR